jgi:hypothetical protein
MKGTPTHSSAPQAHADTRLEKPLSHRHQGWVHEGPPPFTPGPNERLWGSRLVEASNRLGQLGGAREIR